MPKTRQSTFSDPVTPGKHFLTLRSVNEVDSPNLYKKSPSDPDTVTRWVWNWTSDTRDAKGEPMEYVQWTGTAYGDDRAALTTLYDMLLPGDTRDTKMNVDTDTLIGMRVEALITTRINKKGETVPVHRYMIPTTVEAPPLGFDSAGDAAVANAAKEIFNPEAKQFDPDEIPF